MHSLTKQALQSNPLLATPKIKMKEVKHGGKTNLNCISWSRGSLIIAKTTRGCTRTRRTTIHTSIILYHQFANVKERPNELIDMQEKTQTANFTGNRLKEKVYSARVYTGSQCRCFIVHWRIRQCKRRQYQVTENRSNLPKVNNTYKNYIIFCGQGISRKRSFS